MVVLLFIVVQILSCLRSASFGLAVYFGIRLCIPPYVRFAGVSCNTLLLIIYIFLLLALRLGMLRSTPLMFKKHFRYVVILFIALFSLTFFSEFVPIDYQLKELTQFFVTEIIPFLLIPIAIRTSKDYKLILHIVAIASLFNVCYGLFTYVTNSNPLINLFGASIEGVDSDMVLSEEGRFGLKSKAVGIYSDKIFMALVSFLIFTFFYEKKILNRKLLFYVLIISAVTCFFTTQRTALFCLIIFLALASDKQKIRIYIKRYAFLLFLFSFIIVATPPFKPLRDFIYSTFFIFDDKKQAEIGNSGSSVSVRWGQAEGVWEIARPYIFQGLGYGFSSYRQGTRADSVELYGLESFVFKIIVHSGLIGLFFWSLFFYKIVKTCISSNVINDRKYGIAFNISYILAIIMTDTSGSFYLYLVFLELNCNRYILQSNSRLGIGVSNNESLNLNI